MWYVADIPIVKRNRALIISEFLFTSLACLAVSLRIFTRLLMRKMGPDDFFIIASMLGSVGFLIALLHQIKYGLSEAVDPSTIQSFLQAFQAVIIAYNFTQLSVKFSILLQYRSIFSGTSAQNTFRGLIIWVSVYGLFCLLSSIITCWPVEKFWDNTIPGRCLDRYILHVTIAGINIFNDILVFVTPLPYLRNLNIARKAKLILVVVFSCGGFACVAAMVRFHAIYSQQTAAVPRNPVNSVNVSIWSGLEINIAITCTCIPALKSLVIRAFPQFPGLVRHLKISQRHSSTHGNLPLDSVDQQNAAAVHSEENGMAIQLPRLSS